VRYIIVIFGETDIMKDDKSMRVSGEGADEILWIAYDNSYRLLMGEVGYIELEAEYLEGGVIYFIHDRTLGASLVEMEGMLSWYELYEWYERCARILKYIGEEFG